MLSVDVTPEACVTGVVGIIAGPGDSIKSNSRMCQRFVKENEDSWTEEAANIIKGILSFGTEATIETVGIDGAVYVVATGEGKGEDTYTVYIAPEATTTVNLAVAEGTLIVSGEYKVNLTLSGSGDCKPTLKLEGTPLEEGKNDNVKLNPTDGKLTLVIDNTEECNPGFAAILDVQPTYDGGKPVQYTIVGIPLSVKFDRLVAALTCPDFDLDHLDVEVKKSVFAAVLGSNDPCTERKQIFGDTAGQPAATQASGYYWAIYNQAVYAKADKQPTQNDYDFAIIFDGTEPRVWVKDADNYKDKDKIKDIADSIIQNRQYQKYCINFNGTDYYANCKQYHDKILGDFTTGFPAYVGGCTFGTLACEGIWLAVSGGFSWATVIKDIPRAAITCSVQPAIAYLFARFSSTSTAYHVGEGIGFLAQVGVGGYFTARKVGAVTSGVKYNQLMNFVKQYGLFKSTLLGEGTGRITRETIASVGNDIFRMNQEAAKIAGTDFKDIPVWKALGFDNEKTAEAMLEGYVDNERQLVKFLQKTLGEFGEQEGSTKFGEELKNLVGTKRGNVSGFYTVISNQKDQIFQKIKEMMAPKLSKKGMFVCGTVGAVMGTVGYYAATSTGIVYNKLTITADSPAKVVTINASTTYTNNGKIELIPGGE
ncbi:hypothetical protein E3E36_08270 [Thermococcus sp. M36]|uniref:hypothetical protein n=1 Tax=Thermococcus sp. M36 TaxID=1638261 RepID=UPI00143B3604|nr:hypothetical protein [Thermococcus sp. M36]NJE06133.1 hypothetical protein [Thermococcus sp. M36]